MTETEINYHYYVIKIRKQNCAIDERYLEIIGKFINRINN